MSGLSRTPGKRVWGNTPPRVRIPPSPPYYWVPGDFKLPRPTWIYPDLPQKSILIVPVLFPIDFGDGRA